jgi:toxin ParE1/3/4
LTRPVRWFRPALDDLKQQVSYIAADNPEAARRIADRIRDAGNDLGSFATGRHGRVAGTYEKSVPRLPYMIAYSINLIHGRETISIVRIIHTARDWPVDEWPSK